MKKVSAIIIITILFSLQGILAQTVRPWPIPSFNIPVLGMALFQENHPASGGNTEGKRRIHIQVSSQKTPDTQAHSATVWVYSLDRTTLYGPFTVFAGTTLSVDIDDREWGAMVEADETVVVSVWITQEDTMRACNIPEKQWIPANRGCTLKIGYPDRLVRVLWIVDTGETGHHNRT